MAEDWTASEWLEANAPRDEEESLAAARALVIFRERHEDFKQLDALTPFERALAEGAAHAGKHRAVDAIARVFGPGAEMVSAAALREAIAHLSLGLDFGPPRLPRGFGSADRERAAEIVRHAARLAGREVERERDLAERNRTATSTERSPGDGL